MMMKQLALILTLLLSHCALTQEEFSFTLYFEDAVGNKDSLILGYDENGTQLLDEQFGEVDISGEPWDSVFEVRASEAYTTQNMIYLSNDFINPPQYLTKKQIVSKPLCTSDCWPTATSPALSVSVKTDHYPVQVTWVSDVFNSDTCLQGSHIGVNFFSQIPYHHVFLETTFPNSGMQLYEHFPELNFNSYHSEENDTIKIFWVLFCSEHLVNTDSWIKSVDQIHVFPNPVEEKLYVNLENKKQVTQVEIVDILGKIHTTISSNDFKNQEYLDVSFLKSGKYVLKIYSQSDIQVKQFVKL